jgi:hypothetical protein
MQNKKKREKVKKRRKKNSFMRAAGIGLRSSKSRSRLSMREECLHERIRPAAKPVEVARVQKRSLIEMDTLMDTHTECTSNVSLYKCNKTVIQSCLSKIFPNIVRKSTVDFVYLAIKDILLKEQKFTKQEPKSDDISDIISWIRYILSTLDIITELDGHLYFEYELLTDTDISYAIYTNRQVEEATACLQFPVFLNVQLYKPKCFKYNFTIIREVHQSSIIIQHNFKRSCCIAPSYSNILFDQHTLTTLVENAQNATKFKTKFLCFKC